MDSQRPTLVAPVLNISSAYLLPHSESFVSPMTRGVEKNVLEQFAATDGPEQSGLRSRAAFTFNYDQPPAERAHEFWSYDGPRMNASDAARVRGRTGDPPLQGDEYRGSDARLG